MTYFVKLISHACLLTRGDAKLQKSKWNFFDVSSNFRRILPSCQTAQENGNYCHSIHSRMTMFKNTHTISAGLFHLIHDGYRTCRGCPQCHKRIGFRYHWRTWSLFNQKTVPPRHHPSPDGLEYHLRLPDCAPPLQ